MRYTCCTCCSRWKDSLFPPCTVHNKAARFPNRHAHPKNSVVNKGMMFKKNPHGLYTILQGRSLLQNNLWPYIIKTCDKISTFFSTNPDDCGLSYLARSIINSNPVCDRVLKNVFMPSPAVICTWQTKTGQAEDSAAVGGCRWKQAYAEHHTAPLSSQAHSRKV